MRPSIILISMIGTIGRCIHNNHPIEYLRILDRSIPKGKFSIKATPPIRSTARLIIIVLNKIIYFMAKSQAKALPRSMVGGVVTPERLAGAVGHLAFLKLGRAGGMATLSLSRITKRLAMKSLQPVMQTLHVMPLRKN